MQDGVLIVVGQGGSLIDEHLEYPYKLLIDCDDEWMGLIDLYVDLYYLSYYRTDDTY